MDETPKVDPNRPTLPASTTGRCLPMGTLPGGLAMWDGFNWVELPYPNPATGQHLVATAEGPAWANP